LPRFSVAGTATVVGTTARAIASVYSPASTGFYLVEVGIVNTTDVSCEYKLCRLTNATGVGAGLTEAPDDQESPPALATGFAGHTADSAAGDEIRRAVIGAAKGSAMIWTFGGRGIRVKEGTANGIGVLLAAGTGQILDYWYVWDE